MPILLLPVICLFVINKILQYDPEARKVFIAILVGKIQFIISILK